MHTSIKMGLYVAFWMLFSSFLLAIQTADLDPALERVLSSSSIVNVQQIKIPGYPNAYNPSLIPYKGGYLLSFRFRNKLPETIKNYPRTNVSFIGLAKLDKKFKVFEKSVQLLCVVSHSQQLSVTAEDARLLSVGEQIYVFF